MQNGSGILARELPNHEKTTITTTIYWAFLIPGTDPRALSTCEAYLRNKRASAGASWVQLLQLALASCVVSGIHFLRCKMTTVYLNRKVILRIK